MTTLIKVGGSLLSLPDLGVRIERLVASLEDDRVALLIGGGAAADVVREWDRVFRLEPAASHRLAIESMSLTASLMTQLLHRSTLCRSRTEVEVAWRESRVAVLDALPLLAEFESLGCESLPVGWHVTSDSIGAWLAVHWPFERLVLAKSVAAPADLCATDAVDEFFPLFLKVSATTQAQADGPAPSICWCHLREDPVRFVTCTTR